MTKTLKQFKPEAIDIQDEGACPECKQHALQSYRVKGMLHNLNLSEDGKKWEGCGFYCENCGWESAGAREKRPY